MVEEVDTVEQRCLGRHAAAAREVVQLSTSANLTLPQVKLRNRTNLCYCNVVFQCLYWLGEASTCNGTDLLWQSAGRTPDT